MKYGNNEKLIESMVRTTLRKMVLELESNFWNEFEEHFTESQKEYIPDISVSMQQGFNNLLSNLEKIAMENNLQIHKTESQESNLIKVSLIGADPIISYIDNAKGTFTISTPNIRTKHFDYRQWNDALKLIEAYINVDLSSLEKEKQHIYDKYFLNAKTFLIVVSSIKALCNSIFQCKGWQFEIENKILESTIFFKTLEGITYRIDINHKPFSQNPDLLKTFLDEPHEEEIPDFLNCRRLFDNSLENTPCEKV